MQLAAFLLLLCCLVQAQLLVSAKQKQHERQSSIYSVQCSVPSSMDLCLSSLFGTMETALQKIQSSLSLHEKSLQTYEYFEYTMLTSEASHVYSVEKVANSMESYVNSQYIHVAEQIRQLQLELQQINSLYSYQNYKLNELQEAAAQAQFEVAKIVEEELQIKSAKLSVYSTISAILHEKLVVQNQEAELYNVLATLNFRVAKIEGVLSQLNERQDWLSEWEDKLVENLSDLQDNIRFFRAKEEDLEEAEESLVAEQDRLLRNAYGMNSILVDLRGFYESVQYVLVEMKFNMYEFLSVKESIQRDVSIFESAYSEFTCEESLLSAECLSSSSSSASASTTAGPTRT